MTQGGAVGSREVLAFDLYGTDTIGQPPDLTVPALDRLPAALAG